MELESLKEELLRQREYMEKQEYQIRKEYAAKSEELTTTRHKFELCQESYNELNNEKKEQKREMTTSSVTLHR